MDKRNLYIIGDILDFTPQVARLVPMMNYARHTTLTAVKNLTIPELDYLNNSTGHLIGSLLLHIAAAEVGYQAATFYNRQLNENEKHEWDAALALSEKTRQEIKGYDLDHYLNKLKQVRAKTLAELTIVNINICLAYQQ